MNISFSYGYGKTGLSRNGEPAVQFIKNQDGVPHLVNAFKIKSITKAGKSANILFYRNDMAICEAQKRLIFEGTDGDAPAGPVKISINGFDYPVGTWKKEA